MPNPLFKSNQLSWLHIQAKLNVRLKKHFPSYFRETVLNLMKFPSMDFNIMESTYMQCICLFWNCQLWNWVPWIYLIWYSLLWNCFPYYNMLSTPYPCCWEITIQLPIHLLLQGASSSCGVFTSNGIASVVFSAFEENPRGESFWRAQLQLPSKTASKNVLCGTVKSWVFFERTLFIYVIPCQGFFWSSEKFPRRVNDCQEYFLSWHLWTSYKTIWAV